MSNPISSANSVTLANSGPNGFVEEDFLLGRIDAVLIDRPTPRDGDLAGMMGSRGVMSEFDVVVVAIEFARLKDFGGAIVVGNVTSSSIGESSDIGDSHIDVSDETINEE